jgi:Flp pilus assembly protein TadG
MRLFDRGRRGSATAHTGERGQSLVEFAVIFPLFWMCVIALIEFSFIFNAVLTISSASRNAAVIAAEAADSSTADCSILQSVEGDFDAPTFPNQIQKVDIYWTDDNGARVSGAITTYTRTTSSSISCNVNGNAFTVPYTLTTNGYPASARCSTRSGCVPSSANNNVNHPGLDTVGVDITYKYLYKTPYSAVLGGSGLTLDRASEMRVEPFQ